MLVGYWTALRQGIGVDTCSKAESPWLDQNSQRLPRNSLDHVDLHADSAPPPSDAHKNLRVDPAKNLQSRRFFCPWQQQLKARPNALVIKSRGPLIPANLTASDL